jgi:hypothetical protein
MLYKEEILEISNKLNGIIWKKFESTKNFELTYERVFISLQKVERIDDLRVLEILGELGG